MILHPRAVAAGKRAERIERLAAERAGEERDGLFQVGNGETDMVHTLHAGQAIGRRHGAACD